MMSSLQETIYKDYESSLIDESATIMSEKVQSMANGIYQEFERLIERYDATVVKELMPLVVSVLENLDDLEKQRRNGDVEVEMLREDNSALMGQYEREKSSRKIIEEKLMNLEYAYEDEKKHFKEKIDQLEASIRLLELKSRNANDILARMEDKEREQKAEYGRLYERYAEVLKGYADQAERLRYTTAGNSNAGTLSRGGRVTKTSSGRGDDDENIRLQQLDKENNYRQYAQGENDDLQLLEETLTRNMRDEELEPECVANIIDVEQPRRDHSDPEEFDEDNPDYESVGREIENLIKENQELVETKNALNIVKDDLIKKLDFITGENDMLKSELDAQNNRESDLKARVANLELDFKEIRQVNDAMKQRLENVEEPKDSKRFTRVEMAILLKERNQYKERLLELEDALRYTELIRASRQHPEMGFDQVPGGAGVSSGCSSRSKRQPTGIMDIFRNLIKQLEDPGVVEEEKKEQKKATERPKGLTRDAVRRKKCFVFREDAQRSQLYGWSVPRELMQSSVSGHVPTPVASHSILDSKDSIICVTKSPDSFLEDHPKDCLWVIVERPRRDENAYFIAQFYVSSTNEITPNHTSFLKVPKRPQQMLAVPDLARVIEDRYSFGVDDFPSPLQSPGDTPNSILSDYVKVSRVHNTKVKVKQRNSDPHTRTLWISYDDGIVIIYSVNTNNMFDGRLATLFLPGPVSCMRYCQGRVFVAQTDGCLCVFDLRSTNDSWELHQCLVMEMSHSSPIGTLDQHRASGTVWFGSDQHCYVIGAQRLNFRTSFQVNESSNNEQHISRVECIYAAANQELMWVSMSQVGRLFAFDSFNYERKISIDFRQSLLDIIETVDKESKFRFSFPLIAEDTDRLWLGSNCGFIVCLPKAQFSTASRSSDAPAEEADIPDPDDSPRLVYVSCHGFSGSLVNIVSLPMSEKPTSSSLASTPTSSHSLSPSTPANKLRPPPISGQEPIAPTKISSSPQHPLIIALGSSYVNLNSSPSKVSIDDYINRNNVLIWKLM